MCPPKNLCVPPPPPPPPQLVIASYGPDSTAHSNHTSYKNLLHAPMITIIVNMSLQIFYSSIMAHMPSAYGLGKKLYLIKFSSVTQKQSTSDLIKKRRVISDLFKGCKHLTKITHKFYKIQ